MEALPWDWGGERCGPWAPGSGVPIPGGCDLPGLAQAFSRWICGLLISDVSLFW
jgi:hypothetical protein